MPTTIYSQRWRDLINRIFVGKRQGISDLTVLDDVFPTASLFDETQGEFHYARGELAFQVSINGAAGGAGVWTWTGVGNPLGSGRIIVIESMRCWSLIAGAVQGNINTFATSSMVGTPAYRTDTRGPQVGTGVPNPSGGATSGAYASGVVCPASHVYAPLTASVITDNLLDQDVVLKPGWCLVASHSLANTGFVGMMSGYERAGEPDEVA